MSIAMMEFTVTELLQGTTLALATTGCDGEPHAAALYFLAMPASVVGREIPRLYFFSGPNSQHVHDLGRDARAAAAIFPAAQSYQSAHGLQMVGEARLVERGPEWDQVWEVYQSKFPGVASVRADLSRDHMYVFIPHWLRLVDHRRGVDFKHEWEFIEP